MFVTNITFLVSPSDYATIQSTIVTFNACDARRCVDISITNDNNVEKSEMFTVALSKTPGLDSRVSLDSPTTSIQITDVDGRCLYCGLYVHYNAYHNTISCLQP